MRNYNRAKFCYVEVQTYHKKEQKIGNFGTKFAYESMSKIKEKNVCRI